MSFLVPPPVRCHVSLASQKCISSYRKACSASWFILPSDKQIGRLMRLVSSPKHQIKFNLIVLGVLNIFNPHLSFAYETLATQIETHYLLLPCSKHSKLKSQTRMLYIALLFPLRTKLTVSYSYFSVSERRPRTLLPSLMEVKIGLFYSQGGRWPKSWRSYFRR